MPSSIIPVTPVAKEEPKEDLLDTLNTIMKEAQALPLNCGKPIIHLVEALIRHLKVEELGE